MSTTQQNSPQLPTDLILNIISSLPAKSVARFRCLSKLWASILISNSPYFTELFLTHSKTRPHLLFAVQRYDKWWLYSSPQPQIYKNSTSSISVTAEFLTSFNKSWSLNLSPPISGLICCPNMEYNDDRKYPVICNPSTRHLLWLPRVRARGSTVSSYMGYATNDKQFKVLYISYTLPSIHQTKLSNYQILTLESAERLVWRNLKSPLQHCPLRVEVFINGILYYLATLGFNTPNKIACFDFNSEEFKFLDEPWPQGPPNVLVNCKGKLCGIIMEYERSYLELSLWILEDVEKQKWSKSSYVLYSRLWDIQMAELSSLVFVVGMTARGEIVLSLDYVKNPFYVYFFNPEKNRFQRVEIKGFEGMKSCHIQGFVDHVENLKLLEF